MLLFSLRWIAFQCLFNTIKPPFFRSSTMHIARIATSLFLAACSLTACGGSGSDTEGTNVSFTTLAQSSNSGITTREGTVVRNQNEFNALWSKYSSNAVPPPQPPAVDFNTYQVVGYFLGSKPNGCYSMSITQIMQTKERMIVTYRQETPAADTICTAQMVNPAHLVTVPKSPLDVEFVAQ